MEILTKDDLNALKAEIVEVVRQTIRQELGTPSKTDSNSDEYLNTKDAAKFLLVSERQMRNYKASKVIPYSKIGGRLLFRKADLLAFIETHRIVSRYEELNCAPENITVTTDPTIIYSLQGGDVIVGIKAHPTDQQQWSKLMPVCRYLKANDINFQIIK